jgi:hypothetical protein
LTALLSILTWRIAGVAAAKELQVYCWHNLSSMDNLKPSISRTRIHGILEAGDALTGERMIVDGLSGQ